MVLEFEFDSPLFKLLLRTEKIFPVRAKSEMQHADPAAPRWRFWMTITHRKQRDRGISFANEGGDSLPHSIMPSLETQNVDIPLR